MQKGKKREQSKIAIVYEVDPTECPFREFRDHELSADYWGLGPAACRAAILMSGKAPKPPSDFVWVDEQTQPLPRSVRQYLNGWIRAEDLAFERWEAEVVVFEENNGGKMSVIDMQLSHTQVLMRSAFCRKAMSACFILERVEGLQVEHQWESFVFNFGAEGWRAKYLIYSPGMKSGGGAQHRPGLSKNGCYLVRLFYLGTWRCVWVNDQIPVDATDSPLLPFSPLMSKTIPPVKAGVKAVTSTVTASVVYLWPLLICKALLKLAAPDMNSDEEADGVEDELMPEFNILHALTGCMDINYPTTDIEELWKVITKEIPVFNWDEDDGTDLASTAKTKGTKKLTNKEAAVTRNSLATIVIDDTKYHQPYDLPGITPGHEMTLLVSMARDLPLKKPLPEPEVALWKYYRWIDWAKKHGLYDAYDCPRTRYLKVNGLMKLSYAPHLLDVQSTESITFGFREEHEKSGQAQNKKTGKGEARVQNGPKAMNSNQGQSKEELKEWIIYDSMYKVIKSISIVYFPSMFQFTTTGSSPVKVSKNLAHRIVDIPSPKSAPLYLQIDDGDEITLGLCLTMLNPRVMTNSGIPIFEEIEPAYLILEKFDWFVDKQIPVAKAFVQATGYESVEVTFKPGRHFCRLWVHSRMNWHVMVLSESSLLMGARDVIQTAAVRECPWAAKFLNNLSAAFTYWSRAQRSDQAILTIDRDFFKSYQPDLEWDIEIVGYNRALLHWMFRQALQSLLHKRIGSSPEFPPVCQVFRHYFCDPDFGLPPKPQPPKSLRDMVALDPCDCQRPVLEVMEETEELIEEQEQVEVEEKPLVDPVKMAKLLLEPVPPVVSQVCELATEEVPCGILKDERNKMIRKHEAATTLQAYWRGTWARKCLNEKISFTPEVLKTVMEYVFGTLESLSALMNEFFLMYPGAKSAYSVASGLSGVNGLLQYQGTSTVTPRSKWIPHFQGVFFCHAPVKVHFCVQGTLQYSTVMVYNNDTGTQMPEAFNAHITFDLVPNNYGYTVMGHGTLSQPSSMHYEVQWQVTILSSIDGAFHICDNDGVDGCKELPMLNAYKMHIDEMFLPNRRNVLGGILVSVSKHEAVSFRAAAISPELEMVATLRTTSPGKVKELGRCSGKGEIYWPYLTLQPIHLLDANYDGTMSLRSLPKGTGRLTRPSSTRAKSYTKMGPKSVQNEPRITQYLIEVTAPNGWPLTLDQWKRVIEKRNSVEASVKTDKAEGRKVTKEKTGSAKDKDKAGSPQHVAPAYIPHPDDAFIELEVSLTVGGGATARRDDLRDLEFAAARKEWDANEPGRNLRGAQIRKDFRTEFLFAIPPPASESTYTEFEETLVEEMGEEEKKEITPPPGPTPATESESMEMEMEEEEEQKYLLMPDQLRDRFKALNFLPFCMKDRIEDESAQVTNDMFEAAKQDRHARIEAALERMRELQEYNVIYVLGRQRKRCQLLEQLFVEAQWKPELQEVLDERDEAIATEVLNRTMSANKKKLDQKDQKKK